jgi:hypothetical protein
VFSRDEVDSIQLSFGLSAGFIQSQLDQTSFRARTGRDPSVDGSVIIKEAYFNTDIGLSYNFRFLHTLTVKMPFRNRRTVYSYENDNLRKYLIMQDIILVIQKHCFRNCIVSNGRKNKKKKSMDFNLKVYKNIDFGRVWGGLSLQT